LNDHFAVVQNRRAGETPLQSRVIVRAGIHFSEVYVPEQNAVHIKAEQPFGTENRDDALAISGRSGIAMGSFGVALDARNAFVAQPVPKKFAAAFIEAKQAPLVSFLFAVGRAISVDACLEFRLSARLNCSGDIDPILPDDWAGMPKSGNGFLPTDI